MMLKMPAKEELLLTQAPAHIAHQRVSPPEVGAPPL
jgi:hypothetical protein